LGGSLFDLYHSYKLAFEVNSALAAVGIVALFFATMPEPPEAGIPLSERMSSGAKQARIWLGD
jgi:hypothetical protein